MKLFTKMFGILLLGICMGILIRPQPDTIQLQRIIPPTIVATTKLLDNNLIVRHINTSRSTYPRYIAFASKGSPSVLEFSVTNDSRTKIENYELQFRFYNSDGNLIGTSLSKGIVPYLDKSSPQPVQYRRKQISPHLSIVARPVLYDLVWNEVASWDCTILELQDNSQRHITNDFGMIMQ